MRNILFETTADRKLVSKWNFKTSQYLYELVCILWKSVEDDYR